ncbi:MAG TPA: hypothetical protein VF819_10295, partial [Nitrospira sp.]
LTRVQAEVDAAMTDGRAKRSAISRRLHAQPPVVLSGAIFTPSGKHSAPEPFEVGSVQRSWNTLESSLAQTATSTNPTRGYVSMVAQPVPSYRSGKNRNHHVKNNKLSHPSGVDLKAKTVHWGVSGQFLSDRLVTNATTGGDFFEIRPTAGIAVARFAQQDSPFLAPP